MTRPARVLMTADAVGGVWTYALDLAGGLAPHGVETTLAVIGPSPSAGQVRKAQATPGLTLAETGLPLDWMATKPSEISDAAAAIGDLARNLGADLIHLNSPALAGYGGFTAPVLGACHSCLATWWAAVREGPMPADFQWRSAALRRGMLACDGLVAPTRSFAAETARVYGGPTPRTVHNGRRAAAVQDQAREQCVFTSGRLWDAGKNIAVLDAAAGLTSAPLYAAGPLQDPGGGKPIELAQAQAIGRLGEDEIADWLARAPIYASSALYEPFGLGVLEAAQAGCALVLADIPTFRELWQGAAMFVDPKRPDGFAQAFTSLLAEPSQAQRWGRLAQVRSRRFSVQAMTEGLLAIYRSLRPDLAYPAHREAAA